MSDDVAGYLHDHLAGARAGIDLLRYVRRRSEETELSQFADELLDEVRRDRQTLESIADRFGGTRARPIKDALAWGGARAARLKLALIDRDVALLESLEALEVGIYGKLLLWRTLESFAADEPRLRDVDLASLVERARAQAARVEERRLRQAAAMLQGARR